MWAAVLPVLQDDVSKSTVGRDQGDITVERECEVETVVDRVLETESQLKRLFRDEFERHRLDRDYP